MDVVEAIMKIIADIMLMNNISGNATDLVVGAMTGFLQGLIAFVEMARSVFAIFQGLAP